MAQVSLSLFLVHYCTTSTKTILDNVILEASEWSLQPCTRIRYNGDSPLGTSTSWPSMWPNYYGEDIIMHIIEEVWEQSQAESYEILLNGGGCVWMWALPKKLRKPRSMLSKKESRNHLRQKSMIIITTRLQLEFVLTHLVMKDFFVMAGGIWGSFSREEIIMHIVEERWKQSQVGSYDVFLNGGGCVWVITRLYSIRVCLASLGYEEFLSDGRGVSEVVSTGKILLCTSLKNFGNNLKLDHMTLS